MHFLFDVLLQVEFYFDVLLHKDYHFVVYAAKGTKLIGRIMYRISEDGQIQLTDLGADHVYIDLEKGTASPLSLYGTNPI